MLLFNIALVLAINLYLPVNSYKYGFIPNASIDISFNPSPDHGDVSEVTHCDECLCKAFSDSRVDLFTCTKTTLENYICQFYYFMPSTDDIVFPQNGTNIYLKPEREFTVNDDCCDTDTLIRKIASTGNVTTVYNSPLRSLVEGDNNTIVSSSGKKVIKFDKSTFKIVFEVTLDLQINTVGYCHGTYYVANASILRVYDSTLSSLLTNLTVGSDTVTTISCWNDELMFVGTSKSGLFQCKNRPCQTSVEFSIFVDDLLTVNALRFADSNTIYVVWGDVGQDIYSYKRNNTQNDWDGGKSIPIMNQTQISDIFIDDCQRIWAITATNDSIIIYDNSTGQWYPFSHKSQRFNIMILNDYTIAVSHEDERGLTIIKSSVSCRRRKC